MKEDFVFLEVLRPAEEAPKYKSKIRRTIYISVFVIIAFVAAHFLISFFEKQPAIAEDLLVLSVIAVIYVVFLVGAIIAAIFLLAGIVVVFSGKKRAAAEMVGVSGEGITINEKLFSWQQIHCIKPLFQSMFHQITQGIGRPMLMMKGYIGSTRYLDLKLYQLQTTDSSLQVFGVREKERFEEALSQLGKKHLLETKPKPNKLSFLSSLPALLGLLLFFSATTGVWR